MVEAEAYGREVVIARPRLVNLLKRDAVLYVMFVWTMFVMW